MSVAVRTQQRAVPQSASEDARTSADVCTSAAVHTSYAHHCVFHVLTDAHLSVREEHLYWQIPQAQVTIYLRPRRTRRSRRRIDFTLLHHSRRVRGRLVRSAPWSHRNQRHSASDHVSNASPHRVHPNRSPCPFAQHRRRVRRNKHL